VQRMARPRILIYTGILTLIILALALSVTLRSPLKFDVIRDRGLPRTTENGSIDNVYRLQIMNTDESARHYVIEVSGISGATLISDADFQITGATTKYIPARVRVPAGEGKKGSNKLTFIVRDRDDAGVKVTEKAAFIIPR